MPQAPPPAQPVRTLAQRQREAAKLLVRMDEMLKSAGDLGVRARERVSVAGLVRYRAFTRRVRDFFALAAVTEEKVLAVPELAQSPMATALDRMHARMVVLFVDESAAFFDLYARVRHYPVGTYEMCGVELRGLIEIRRFLDDPRYEGERGTALAAKCDRIAERMRAVMARIPPLPDFGDSPSIGPKGEARRPTRPPKRAAARPPAAPPPPPEPAPEPEAKPLELRWLDDDGTGSG